MADTSLADLYDDNQKTSAIGYPPMLAATQGGPMDGIVTALGVLSTMSDGASFGDARTLAFMKEPSAGLPQWKMGEATGVHAEAIIMRAWIEMAIRQNGMSLQQAVASLRGRTIHASQPACWCCHALMTKWGIAMGDNNIGKKPLTGWRHPLAGKTVANSDLPKNYTDVAAWLG